MVKVLKPVDGCVILSDKTASCAVLVGCNPAPLYYPEEITKKRQKKQHKSWSRTDVTGMSVCVCCARVSCHLAFSHCVHQRFIFMSWNGCKFKKPHYLNV